MALITRISRLFTADLHAVLDRIEEPEALLRQAIREMEDELARTEQRIKWLQHEQDQLQGREGEIEESLQDLEEKLDVCFESDNEELARTLIKRKLEAQRVAKSVAAKRQVTAKSLAEQQAAVEENRARLESMRQKAELLTEDARDGSTATGDDPGWSVRELAVGDDEVEVALLREKQRRSRS